MDKLALIEFGTSHLRLTIYHVRDDHHFTPYQQLVESIDIDDHLLETPIIKAAKIKECISILQMFKKICESYGVSRYIAIGTHNMTIAKNYQSVIDEAGVAIGINFKVMSDEEETAALYTATTNMLEAPKGVSVHISSRSVRIINYNRRIVLDSAVIPLGTATLFAASGDDTNKVKAAVDLFKKELMAKAPFTTTIDPETLLVGSGEVFSSYGKLARKITKHPIDIEHNYVTTRETFDKVFKSMSELDPAKKVRLRGIGDTDSSTILAGLCIMQAILDVTGMNNLVVSSVYRNAGLMFNHALPFTLERPITDILGYSLDAIIDNAGLNKKQSESMYNVSLMLFKQLKVLHKLSRLYARVLRIASRLYHLGKTINPLEFERNNYAAILGSPITGCSHKDIVLASFCASCKRWEDFNLAEWVRYKDIMNDEDLEAVKRISNILNIAEALNIRNQDIIKDINCDILGDSVILKLITETDAKAKNVDPNLANLEIYYANKLCGEFEKAFKKRLEIL